MNHEMFLLCVCVDMCYVVKLLEGGEGQLLMGTNSGCMGFVYIDLQKVVFESEVTSQDTCQT